MKDATIKYVTHDGSPLTERQIALGARIGDSIHCAEATPEQWATAVSFRHFKPRKDAISLRIDMDVLAWLRRYGPGYQTKINAILREKMLSETEPQA